MYFLIDLNLIEIFVFDDTNTLDHIIHSRYILYFITILIYYLSPKVLSLLYQTKNKL